MQTVDEMKKIKRRQDECLSAMEFSIKQMNESMDKFKELQKELTFLSLSEAYISLTCDIKKAKISEEGVFIPVAKGQAENIKRMLENINK